MSNQPSKQRATKWHQIFAWVQREFLREVGIQVQSELPLGDKPPQVDLVLLRLSGRPQWTALQRERLPDGIRDSKARHILLEFKYTESFGRKAVLQALVYYSLYRWVTPHRLVRQGVQTFIVVSKTPHQYRRERFGYQPTNLSGVYESDNVLLQSIPLIVLNELSDARHNVLFKLFASRHLARVAAVSQLRQVWWSRLPIALLRELRELLALWTLKGEPIMGELTVENLKQSGEENVLILLDILLSGQEAQAWFEKLPQVQAAQQQGLERGIERGIEQGLEQGIERGIEQGLERGIEQGLERGIEQGLEQGIERGIEQGLERGKQNMIQTIIRTLTVRFGEALPSEWMTHLEQAKSLEALTELHDHALMVTTLAEFEPYLPNRSKT